MRICDLVTFALICLAPVYYGRQYNAFTFKQSNSKFNGSKYEGAEDFEGLEGLEDLKDPNTLPAIWKPMPYQSAVFGDPGLSIYKPRKKRYLLPAVVIAGYVVVEKWEWIKDKIAVAVSAVRMVMDVLSTAITVIKVVGWIAVVVMGTVFPPAGLTGAALMLAFNIIHAGVSIADQVLNDGQPHPALGQFGEVMQEITVYCGYVDTFLAFVDSKSVCKSIGKGIRKVIKRGSRTASNEWAGIVKKWQRFPETAAALPGKIKKAMAKNVMKGAKNMFDESVKAAGDLIDDILFIIKKGVTNVVDCVKSVLELFELSSIQGAVTKISADLVALSKNFESKQALLECLKGLAEGAKTWGKDNKGVFQAILVEIFHPRTARLARFTLEMVEKNTNTSTEEIRFYLTYYISVANIVIAPGKLANARKKYYKKVDDMPNVDRIWHPPDRIVNEVKTLREFEEQIGAVLARVKERGKKRQVVDGKEIEFLEMCLDLAKNVKSIEDLKTVLKLEKEVMQTINSTSTLAMLYEQTVNIVENAKDLDEINEAFHKIDEVFEKIPNIDEYEDFLTEMSKLTQGLVTHNETGHPGDALRFLMAMDDPNAAMVTKLKAMDSLIGVVESNDDFKKTREVFMDMERVSRSAEGNDTGVMEVLVNAARSFNATKEFMGVLLEVSNILEDFGDFEEVLTTFDGYLVQNATGYSVYQKIKKENAFEKAPELYELFRRVTKTTDGLTSLKTILKMFSDKEELTKHNLDLKDLQLIFQTIKTSESLESPGELLDVLNRVGIFSKSFNNISEYQEVSAYVMEMTQAHLPEVIDAMKLLPDHENFTVVNFTKSLEHISKVPGYLKTPGNLTVVLPALYNTSRTLWGMRNLTRVLRAIGDIGYLEVTEEELLNITEHFKTTLASSKSLDELQSLYKVMEERLNNRGNATELQWVHETLNINRPDAKTTLGLVHVLRKLVDNLQKRSENPETNELYLFLKVIFQAVKHPGHLKQLCDHLRMFTNEAKDFDDLEDMTRAFGTMEITHAFKLFLHLTAKGSKTMTDFGRNLRAFRVLISQPKQDTQRFLKFSDALIARSRDLEHLHNILAFLGTAPEDVKSRQASYQLFNSMSQIVTGCENQDCITASSEFLTEIRATEMTGGTLRKTLETYENMAERADGDKGVQVMFGSAVTMLKSANASMDALEAGAEFMGDWAKAQDPNTIKESAKVLGAAFNEMNSREGNGTRKRRSPESPPQTPEEMYKQNVEPFFQAIGMNPFDIANAEEFEAFMNLTQSLESPEKELNDISECMASFERIKDGEQVVEILDVARKFNFTDEPLGKLTGSAAAIENVENVKEIPQLVKDVKENPENRKQINDMAGMIAELMGLRGGVFDLVNPLKNLGTGETRGFLNGSRAEVMKKLEDSPELIEHFQALVDSLQVLFENGPTFIRIIGRGVFGRNSSITHRVSDYLRNLTTTKPITGLANLSRVTKNYTEGVQLLDVVDNATKAIGNISEAIGPLKDVPVVMNMPGCQVENIQKVETTLITLGVEKHNDPLAVMGIVTELQSAYSNLTDGANTLDNIAGHLGIAGRLVHGGLSQFKAILKEIEEDSEDLESLAPDLETIHRGTKSNSSLEEVVLELKTVSAQLDVLLEFQNQIPEILEKVGILLSISNKKTTSKYITTPPTLAPTSTPSPAAQSLPLKASTSCLERSQGSKKFMKCPGYCSKLRKDPSSIFSTWNILLSISAASLLLLSLGFLILRKCVLKSSGSQESNDIELAFTSNSDSDLESVSSLASKMSTMSVVSAASYNQIQVQPDKKAKKAKKDTEQRNATESGESRLEAEKPTPPSTKPSPSPL